MKLNNETAKKLKEDFPIFKNNPNLVYLDNAATSQKPKRVIKAMEDFYEKENANVSRGVYTLAEKATKRYEDSRKKVAKFINAKTEEIIFTKNTTESINLLTYTIDSLIGRGKDEIVLTEMEHHSNLVPWQHLAKEKNMKLKFIKLKSNFTLDMEDAEQKITNKTAIVSFAHVSNVLGTINSAEQIIKLSKNQNALTIIDAAQSVGNIEVDVKKLGCDFLAFSSHKILGPLGVGVLYGKKELLEKLKPFNYGGGMIESVSLENSTFAKLPQKLEAGTQNYAGVVGFAEAIKYIEEIELSNIKNWKEELTDYALEKLKEIEGIEIHHSYKDRTGIISFNLKGIHPHDVAEILNQHKIAVRAGHHCARPLMKTIGAKYGGTIRASFAIYNTFDDLDRLTEILKKVNEIFKKNERPQ